MGAPNITVMLDRIAAGDREAAEALMPVVYEELRRIAGSAMRAQGASHTLQPTALVHEAYLRLLRPEEGYRNRAHFMAVASIAMGQILKDHARRKRAARRGGDRRRADLDPDLLEQPEGGGVDIVALDDALSKLKELDPRRHRVIELRFFGGLTMDEVAAALGVSRSTVEADWRGARAWLGAEMGEG